MDADQWQSRVDAVWADEDPTGDDRVAQIDALARERPAADAVALFERAGARDAAGREAEAEVLYRAALARGLDDARRAQATIQLGSTLRNLGRVAESIDLLEAEFARVPASVLRDEAAAFLALSLASAGRGRAAAAVALRTLAPHLQRYARAVTAYSADLGVDG